VRQQDQRDTDGAPAVERGQLGSAGGWGHAANLTIAVSGGAAKNKTIP
jgi:hypothetical protein